MLRKWTDEKTMKMDELTTPESSCCLKNSTWDDDESIREELNELNKQKQTDEEHENLIRMSQDVLRRHGRHRAEESVEFDKQWRNWRNPSPPKNKKKRSRHGHNATSEFAELDENQNLTQVNVHELRFSQKGCRATFRCGRSVLELTDHLMSGKISLSAPFLRLTVFETRDEWTKRPVLRCIDNRRLYALKQYARKSRQDPLMVNVILFTYNTLMQTQRFIHNSDDTDGFSARLRTGSNKGKGGRKKKQKF